MNRNFIAALFGVALFMGTPLFATVQEFIGPDGVTPIKVSATNPLPSDAQVTVGSITADLNGNVQIIGQTVSSLTVHVDNLPATQAVSVTGTPNVAVTGTPTVALAPSITFTQSSRIASPTAGSFTTSAGCEAVTLFNLGAQTIWVSLDGAGATVSAGIPCGASQSYQQSFSCGPNKAVYFVASATTSFTSVESGR